MAHFGTNLIEKSSIDPDDARIYIQRHAVDLAIHCYSFESTVGEPISLQKIIQWEQQVCLYIRLVPSARQTEPHIWVSSCRQSSFLFGLELVAIHKFSFDFNIRILPLKKINLLVPPSCNVLRGNIRPESDGSLFCPCSDRQKNGRQDQC